MVWHILRVEDMFLSNVVFRRDQEFHRASWQAKLGITTPHVGTGMSKKEADELSKAVIIPSLIEYNQAVREHTNQLLTLIEKWPTDQLDKAEEIEVRLKTANAFPKGVLSERARAYAPTPVSDCLLGVINHGYMHFGQFLALTKPL